VYPVSGISLLASLNQSADAGPIHTQPFGDESYGRAYLRSADGRWKALWTEPPLGPLDGHWQLFDLSTDRGETTDVSAQFPDVAAALYQQWQGYMRSVGGVEPLRPHGFY
jgi:arylsulfatase